MDDENSPLSSYERILPALHQLSNIENFDSFITENPVISKKSVMETYLKILQEFCRQCNDYSFIIRGPITKLRAAYSFVSILTKFAVLYPRLKQGNEAFKSLWTTEFLEYTISKIFQWDTLLNDVEPSEEMKVDPEFGKLRHRLSSEIVYSFKYILESKFLYNGEMPIETTNWLINIEKRDYRMFSTPVYLYDNLISYVLAETYR